MMNGSFDLWWKANGPQFRYTSKGVFTCSILASIVAILVSIEVILTSIEPILGVHLQV